MEPVDADPDDGDEEWWGRTMAKDVLVGIGVVVALVFVLFLISGVWPPFVAIESGSMEPHMSEGDLVFLVDGDRFTSYDGVADTNFMTYEQGSDIGHTAFGQPGHVVVFETNQGDGTSIIHRLHMWVQEGENWFDRANPEFLGGANSCAELTHCPAPHDGFITKGDANEAYDQANGQSTVIKQDWITGRALVRIPFLGEFRLNL